MHRVLILLLLAIAGNAFAVDSSDTILQAKSIGDTSITLSWAPLENARSYKIIYDEEALLTSPGAKPLLDTDFTDKTTFQVAELNPGTEYIFIVQWYDENKQELSSTLPVHIKTFKTSLFTQSGDPIVLDTKKIKVSFTRGIDIKKTQIIVTNSKTKKIAMIDRLENDSEDLRVVYIILKKDIEKDVPYDITFKKVTTQAGSELPAEQRTTLKVVYGDAGTVPIVPPPAPGEEDEKPVPPSIVSDKAITEPVPIDQLPKTGPGIILIVFLSSIILAFWIQKKLRERA